MLQTFVLRATTMTYGPSSAVAFSPSMAPVFDHAHARATPIGGDRCPGSPGRYRPGAPSCAPAGGHDGLDTSGQTRIAASVSEISRNAIAYAGGGRVTIAITRTSPMTLCVRVSDNGPGIRDLDAVMDGCGAGRGITNARRLVEDFTIVTRPAGQAGPGGAPVTVARRLPDGAMISAADVARIVGALGNCLAPSPVAELRTPNKELIASLAELRTRQEELLRLNTELEDTNRGVVALYAELDERADQLRQASELKSRFLSNMSHEFRTPLNSILALSRLLMDRTDGPLTAEQERQVTYIRRSAESLTELVNDLLDLAKVEAGKLEIRPRHFTISELFGAPRGVMKPLQQNGAVELIFEEPANCPALFTDEAKVARILRNLISNSLKFTERGEVRVGAKFEDATGQCDVEVMDTGIGIAREDQELVFQEFFQVANLLQFRAKRHGPRAAAVTPAGGVAWWLAHSAQHAGRRLGIAHTMLARRGAYTRLAQRGAGGIQRSSCRVQTWSVAQRSPDRWHNPRHPTWCCLTSGCPISMVLK
jgi:signal transduction histidine kinase